MHPCFTPITISKEDVNSSLLHIEPIVLEIYIRDLCPILSRPDNPTSNKFDIQSRRSVLPA